MIRPTFTPPESILRASPAIAARMVTHAARECWCAVLQDGRTFFFNAEDSARAAQNMGATIFRPGSDAAEVA